MDCLVEGGSPARGFRNDKWPLGMVRRTQLGFGKITPVACVNIDGRIQSRPSIHPHKGGRWNQGRLAVYRRSGKRFFDLALAFSLLLLLWPVLLITAALIRLESPGPALFVQKRLGRHAQAFRIYKFRTMHHRPGRSADQRFQSVVAGRDDARITPLGRFLRRTSIDELPQLFNVIGGSMSVVGPRPVLPDQLLAMNASDLRRFDTAPGITGLAQIKGRRALSWPRQMRFDRLYAERSTLALDLRILRKTLRVALAGSDVYGGEKENWRSHLARGNATAHETEGRP